jgi:hypothetical protein
MKYIFLTILLFFSNYVFASDYQVIVAMNPLRLENKVRGYLNSGYKLGGFSFDKGFLYQVVYKED